MGIQANGAVGGTFEDPSASGMASFQPNGLPVSNYPKMPPKKKSTSQSAGSKGVCCVCCQALSAKDEALYCDGACQQWLHRYCASVTLQQYKAISDSGSPYLCSCCCRERQQGEMITLRETVEQQQDEMTTLREAVEAMKLEIVQLKETVTSLTNSTGEQGDIPKETPWNVVARGRGRQNPGSRPPPKDKHAQSKSVHSSHHPAHTERQQNHLPRSRIPLKGARKIWGTLRHTTTLAVQNTLKALTKCSSGLTIKRKFKTADRNQVTKWWFVLRGEEQLLEQLQEKWPAVSVQTSWKLEPVLSYGDIPDNPNPPTAEQQMECGKRSAANSGGGHDDSAHSIPGNSVRIHSDSDVENNRGEATTVEPGSPGSFLGQQ